MGFTKLDERILQSSVMAESGSVFKVWIALLASCGQDGIAKVSSVFLASTCHLSLKMTDHALEILSGPDPRSRSLAEDGRRIVRVDGGFHLVNYEKYRAFTYSENPESVRKREYRHRNKAGEDRDIPGHVGTCPGHSASASVSASVISLNLQGWVWEGISCDDRAAWQKAYPACDIDRELLAMIEWAKANPAKAHKKNYRRFITNWLTRSQERGGGMRSVSLRETSVLRDLHVGARPEKTSEEKKRDAEKHRLKLQAVERLHGKWDPIIAAAKTNTEKERLHAEAEAETQREIQRIEIGGNP